MSREEKLERILAKCRQIAFGDYRPDSSLPSMRTISNALAISTMIAIESLREIDENTACVALDDICDAWRTELLK